MSELLDVPVRSSLAHYDRLAGLFDYPSPTFAASVEAASGVLRQTHPEAAVMLQPFAEYISSATLIEMEELYTRSFDVQSITTLDIGYVMFGDDYKRAEILVNLNREHQEAGNECGTELPDHLPNVLRLLPKMKSAEMVDELVHKIVGPAIAKMKSEFSEERLEKKKALYKKHHKTVIAMSETHGLLYGRVLEALYEVLRRDFQLREPLPIKQTSAFLRSVENEMKTERE